MLPALALLAATANVSGEAALAHAARDLSVEPKPELREVLGLPSAERVQSLAAALA